MTPGGSGVTNSDCDIKFNSTNDTAKLLMTQVDDEARAMHRKVTLENDQSWSSDGTATVDWGGSDWPRATAIVTDGSGGVYVAGYDVFSGNYAGRITHFLANGTPDPAFGSAGTANYDLSAGADTINSIALSGSSLVFAGIANDNEMMIGRASATTGAVDMSFNGVGYRSLDPGGAGECIDVFVDSDGYVCVGTKAAINTDLWKVNTSGTTLAAFGGGSFAPAGMEGGPKTIRASNGDLLVNSEHSSGNARRIQRYDWTTGSVVTTWATSGTLDYTPTPQFNAVSEVKWDDDGRMVVFGDGGTGSDEVVVRITAGGQLDTSFGTAGVRRVNHGGDTEAWAGEPLDDGRVLIAGYDGPGYYSMTLSNGSNDPAWGGVQQTTGFQIWHMAQDADSTLYSFGTTSTDDIRVDRWANGTVPQFVSGSSDFSSVGGTFGACIRAVANGASAAWAAPTGSCTSAGVGSWNSVAVDALAPTALVATTSAGQLGYADVYLRFGMRVSSSLTPGAYIAPIQFQVIAPAV